MFYHMCGSNSCTKSTSHAEWEDTLGRRLRKCADPLENSCRWKSMMTWLVLDENTGRVLRNRCRMECQDCRGFLNVLAADSGCGWGWPRHENPDVLVVLAGFPIGETAQGNSSAKDMSLLSPCRGHAQLHDIKLDMSFAQIHVRHHHVVTQRRLQVGQGLHLTHQQLGAHLLVQAMRKAHGLGRSHLEPSAHQTASRLTRFLKLVNYPVNQLLS